RVPKNHREQGYRLGQWVRVQRQLRETMPLERRQRLGELGFVWDVLNAQWEEGFHYLQLFHEREGHCRVPLRLREQGYRLGQWVRDQRKDKETMPLERRKRLEELGFVWNALVADWEDGFAALQQFRQREGHCRVPQGHLEQGFRLGQWVSRQRQV